MVVGVTTEGDEPIGDDPLDPATGVVAAPAFVVAPPYSWATKPMSPAVLSTQLMAVNLVMDWTRRTPISREVGGV